MNLDQLYPSRFIGADEFAGKSPTLTIAKVMREELGHGGSKESKVVLYFAEKSKATGDQIQLVLNRTNATAIAAMFGREADDWAGHKVTLVAEEVQFGAEKVPGVRIKGSPELMESIRIKAEKMRNIPARTLVPTGNGRPTAPAPEGSCDQRRDDVCPECDANPCTDMRGPLS